MSNDENSTESVNESEEAKNTTENESIETSNTEESPVAKIMALKESNPKVFFGGIAGLVGIVVIALSMGGDSGSKHLPASKNVNLSIGQTYSLKGVNSYNSKATIRLVSVPGSIAAYDDSEDKGSKDPCKHAKEGTKVKLLQIQAAFGKANFAEIELIAGQCAGRKGWVNSTNLN